MTLREERTLYIIEIISLAFIIFSSICLQFIDSKIKDYDDYISILEVRRSQYLQLVSYNSQRIYSFEILANLGELGKPLGQERCIRGSTIDYDIIEPEHKKLIDSYKANKISAGEYLLALADLHRKKYQYYLSRVNQLHVIIKDLRLNPPRLFKFDILKLKSACFIIQLMGACVALILFLKLLIGLNRRIAG